MVLSMTTETENYIYDARNKKMGKYYFYTGKYEHDWQSMFICQLLNKGYIPKTETDLIEMYLELCAGDSGIINIQEITKDDDHR